MPKVTKPNPIPGDTLTLESTDEIAVFLDDAATPAILGQNIGQPKQGTTAEAIAIGVSGNAPAGYGVMGHSVSQYGVYGQSDSQAGVRGESQRGDAVVGVASSKSAAGISGQNTAEGGGLAGRFQGDVDVSGQLTVSGTLAIESPVVIDSNSSNPAAFTYTVAPGDMWPDQTLYGTGAGYPLCAVINKPSLKGLANALLFVTPSFAQQPATFSSNAGNVTGGTAVPQQVPAVIAMYGAAATGLPPTTPNGSQGPAFPAPITEQWVLIGASPGQQFNILVVNTQAGI